MTSLTVAGTTIGGLDTIPGVVDAANKYTANSTPENLTNYQAALANAAAALSSGIQGVGAAFAGNALVANIDNLVANGAMMNSSEKLSAMTSIVGDLLTMAGQGVTFAGLEGTALNPILGGGTFTAGQLLEAAGFVATAVGAGLDSTTIANIVSQAIEGSGLTPDANGYYVPSSFSSSNFVCNADNAATMFDISQHNNTDQIGGQSQSSPSTNNLPTVTVSPQGVVTVIANGQGDDFVVSPGIAEQDLNLEVIGDNNSASSNTGVVINPPINSPLTPEAVKVYFVGNNNSATGGAGSVASSSGQGNTFDFTDGSVTVVSGGADVIGNNNIIASTPGASSVLLGISGFGDLVNASNVGVNVSNGASVTIVGSDDSIFGGAGSEISIEGQQDSASVSNGSVYLYANAGVTVTGSSDNIYGQAGDAISLNGQSDTVNASDSGVYLYGDTAVTVVGSSDSIYGQAGDAISVEGQSDAVEASDSGVYLYGDTDVTVVGSSDGIYGQAGDAISVNGQSDAVEASDSGVYLYGGTGVTVIGSSDEIYGQAGDDISVNGQSDAVEASDSGVYLYGDTGVTVVGSSDNIYGQAGDGISVNGQGDVVDTSDSGIYLYEDTGVTVAGSGDVISGQADDVISVNGQGDAVEASASDDSIDIFRQSVNANGQLNVTLSHPDGSYFTQIYASSDPSSAIVEQDWIDANGALHVRMPWGDGGFQETYNDPQYGKVKLLQQAPGENIAWVDQAGAYAVLPPSAAAITFNFGTVNPNGIVSSTPVNPSGLPSGMPIVFEPESGDPGGVIVTPVPTPDPDPGTPLDPPTQIIDASSTDPIILNLQGGSVQTTSLSNSPAYFDMQSDGQKVRTGWATAGEGLLAYDPTNTGTVTNDASLVQSLSALASLDSNGDGVLDSSDAAWSSMKVWIDPTGAATFQQGELVSLPQLNITSIDLNGKQANQDNNGNEILVDSNFTYANGSTGDIAGVDLVYEPSAAQTSMASAASLSDAQINNLIAGMAAFGAQGISSATPSATAASPETILVAPH